MKRFTVEFILEDDLNFGVGHLKDALDRGLFEYLYFINDDDYLLKTECIFGDNPGVIIQIDEELTRFKKQHWKLMDEAK